MKTLRQDNPGTRVTFVSIMADPRALVTVLIALINYIITTYVELQGAFIVYLLKMYVNSRTAFSQNLLSDRIINWRNWNGERGDSYEDHAMTKQQ